MEYGTGALWYLSHPILMWLYVFSLFPPSRPPPLLTSKPFELNLRYLGQRKYRSGKMYWMTFWWPWPKVTAVPLITKNLQDKVRTTQLITTNLGNDIPLVMLITWLDFRGILLETFFFAKFSLNISDVFFQGQTLYWTYLRNGWSDGVKRKGGALVGYWVNYETLTFDLTHDLDLWFFKVKLQNSYISRMVIWLMWNKKKTNQLDTGLTVWSSGLALWPHPRSKFEILIWGMGWGWGVLIDMEQKGCESIIHDHNRNYG